MSISQYIYNAFTKPHIYLSVGEIATGLALIIGGIFTLAIIITLLSWMAGLFNRKNKKKNRK